MDLIVTEKPSAAKAIVEALGGFRTRQGYYESREWLLTWAVGHLAELCEPGDYDPALVRWKLETLPIIPSFRLRPAAGSGERLGVIRRLAERVDGLVNACDAAREGELIFRQIADLLDLRLPVRRLWVSSLTKEAIRKGFANLRPSADYDRLFRSAECRARGDWLVGINATRAFSCKSGGVYSVGRVQTPTLAMIVEREAEVTAFVARDFWEVLAGFKAENGGEYEGRWFTGDERRLFDRAAAQALVERVKGRPGRITEVTVKDERENPPLLFDLTSLQREANRRWGMSASATLAAAQRLYEAKLITYPRTDSRFLTPDVARTTPRIIDDLTRQPEFAALGQGADRKAIYGHGRVVNPGRVADHHAIIPTGEQAERLGAAEAKIYTAVVRRFLAQFYEPAIDRVTTAVTAVGVDTFETVARENRQVGWRVAEAGQKGMVQGPSDAPSRLPDGLTEGLPVTCAGARLKTGRTEPPPRFTEGSLLAAMETAGRKVDDEVLREAMKGRGLGTPATRAAIIDRLKKVGYIEIAARRLRPTDKGRQLIEAARAAGAEVLLSPQLTGEWERRIDSIQTAEVDPTGFMSEIEAMTWDLVDKVKGWTAAKQAGVADGPPEFRCPLCGRPVTLVKGRWVCAGAAEGCEFSVGSWLLGRRIEPADVAELCARGRTKLLTGFRSRNGRCFSARLVAGQAGVTFAFAERKGEAGRRRPGPKARRKTRPQGRRKAGKPPSSAE